MEEDFIATIKLTTGEELISKVSYMPDDDSLVLDSPMEVTKVNTTNKNLRVGGFALTEWITSTFDHTFVLPRKFIITMTEIEDPNIKNFYTITVQRQQIELSQFKEASTPQQFTRDMGHLGSVNKTKETLENLYKRS